MKLCYVIATWSGKRRNPSKEYLKQHLKRLFELKHSIEKIVVVKPIGSDDKDYYDIDEETLSKIEILERPQNDRSYGQFLFAYKTFGNQFSHYIIAEDDYIPNIDDFDSRLAALMDHKGCDYLCGKYGRTKRSDPDHPQQNMGIIKASAFEKIVLTDPNPFFYKNGDNDGQEFIMFGNLFAKNGLMVADYSDYYSVPYFDRYLHWFTENRGTETIFVPFQLLHHKAFTYEESDERSPSEPDSHFLMDMTFDFVQRHFIVKIDGRYAGSFQTYRETGLLFIRIFSMKSENVISVLERFVYENRMEAVYTKIDDKYLIDEMKKRRWVFVDEGKTNILKKSYYE